MNSCRDEGEGDRCDRVCEGQKLQDGPTSKWPMNEAGRRETVEETHSSCHAISSVFYGVCLRRFRLSVRETIELIAN